jgi:hypothetical protein
MVRAAFLVRAAEQLVQQPKKNESIGFIEKGSFYDNRTLNTEK